VIKDRAFRGQRMNGSIQALPCTETVQRRDVASPQSDRDHGGFEIWKMLLSDGPLVQVTKNGGVFGVESADGRFFILRSTKRQEYGECR